jgi:hypothetical protein
MLQNNIKDAFMNYINPKKFLNGTTWNGDINFSSLGENFESRLLALDQKMVLPETNRKSKSLLDTTLFDKLFNDLLLTISSMNNETQSKSLNLLFRYLFYLRSVRVPGKKSRLLFYWLFKKLYNYFPRTACALLELIPEFGYFGDLDYIMKNMNNCFDIVQTAQNIYIKHLNSDCNLLFNKPLIQVSLNDAKSMNQTLKNMSVQQIREFTKGKQFSLASKWFKREGKRDSSIRNSILLSIYKPKNLKSMNYCQMVFRHILSSLSQCLLVGEQMMCEKNNEMRTWADIPLENAPAKFITKYRKALANEKIGEILILEDLETGNRFKDNPDRIICRQNLIKTLLEGKLKGAVQDIDKLSKIIYESNEQTITLTERKVIATQWDDLVNKIKTEINQTIEESKIEAQKNNIVFLDPRNVIPVVDTSGSMYSAKVQDVAIGLGILATQLSTLPGCMMSFSERPEIFYLNMNGTDVFDHFQQIMRGPTGLSTNIDATYRLLLNVMLENKVSSTDFALLFLTDGQFNSQVMIQGNDYYRRGRVDDDFLSRIEIAFNEKGYNLPRMIFWNLNCYSPGFPATSLSKGVQLVSGYSQSLMLQVFTGDYKYELQNDGSMKINVNPWDSFLKALLHQDYDIVSQILAQTSEGCLKELVKNN